MRRTIKVKEIEFGDLQTWKENYPLLNKLISLNEILWLNPKIEKFKTGIKKSPLLKTM